jgi:hypothetical protein
VHHWIRNTMKSDKFPQLSTITAIYSAWTRDLPPETTNHDPLYTYSTDDNNESSSHNEKEDPKDKDYDFFSILRHLPINYVLKKKI